MGVVAPVYLGEEAGRDMMDRAGWWREAAFWMVMVFGLQEVKRILFLKAQPLPSETMLHQHPA